MTGGSLDNLKFLANGSADMGIVLADSLDDAYHARGVFSDFGAVPARALAVLYDNYNHVVTVTSKEIGTLADLKGRLISTGSPGSGTEVSAFRILEAGGVNPETDIRRQSLGAAQSVGALKDDKIDAFFWSGGIPTGSVLDLATTPGRTIQVVPNAAVLATLAAEYGDTVYHVATIPRTTYPGMETDVDVIAVANVLVVHEEMPDELAYRIVQALFEHHDEMAAIHAMAALLTLDNAVIGSPVPFHPGAARYYADQGRPVE